MSVELIAGLLLLGAAGVGVAARKRREIIKAVPITKKLVLPTRKADLESYARSLELLLGLGGYQPFVVTAEKIPEVWTTGAWIPEKGAKSIPTDSDIDILIGGALVELLMGENPYAPAPDAYACEYRWTKSGDPFWCCSEQHDKCELWNPPVGLDPAARAEHLAAGYRKAAWLWRADEIMAEGDYKIAAIASPLAELVQSMMAAYKAGPPDAPEAGYIEALKAEEGHKLLGWINRYRAELAEQVVWAYAEMVS